PVRVVPTATTPAEAATIEPDRTPPTHMVLVEPPTHMVLVHSFPSAARVTYEGRSFGYTPTYAHVPGFTPVRLQIERKGWKPVTQTVTSPHPGSRLTVRLEHIGPIALPVRRRAPEPERPPI